MAPPSTFVLIAGAGPAGLATAWTLLRAGVPAKAIRVIDARPNPIDGLDSRALGIHPRTLESLGPDVAARLVGAGKPMGGIALHDVAGRLLLAVDLTDDVGQLTRYPYVLTLAQGRTEEILRAALKEKGVRPEWGVAFAGLEAGARPGEPAVVARLDRGGKAEAATASFLVGADGLSSSVRGAAGIATASAARGAWNLLADVEVAGPGLGAALARPRAFLGPFQAAGPGAAFSLTIPMERDGWVRIVFDGPPAEGADRGQTAKPVLGEGELRRLFRSRIPFAAGWTGGRPLAEPSPLAGAALEIKTVGWTSAFRVREQVASSFRAGRVFLVGDAAHAHSPAGGQGMNLGIQDGAALGWRLGAVCGGRGGLADGSPGAERLLDSYSAERRPVAAARVRATGLAARALMEARSAAFASLRNALLGAVGRSPRLLARLNEAAGTRLTMLRVSYPRDGRLLSEGPGGGPWRKGSPGPGRRAPLAAGALTERLDKAGQRFLAVVWGGAAPASSLPRSAFETWADPPADVVEALGGRPDRPGAAVIRPDGFVGWRGAGLGGAEAWWARLVAA